MIPAALAQAVAAAQDAPSDRALGLIRPFFEDIAWFSALLAQGCDELTADPRHLPGLRASRSGGARHLVLARTERIWVSATVIEPNTTIAPRIYFSGRHLLCRPLDRALLGDWFMLEGDRAIPHGVLSCPTGEMLQLDERRETVRLRVGGKPLMLLRAQVAPPGPVVSHIHDATTGARIATAQTDEGHARTLMLLSLLRVQGRKDAGAHFAQTLDALLAGQRWAVMREYLALDAQAAMPKLRAMAVKEQDEAVRALAMRTLRQLESVPCPA